MKVLRQHPSALDECDHFDGHAGLEALVSHVHERLPRAIYVRGTALDTLIQGAALDVLEQMYASERHREQRLAQFIEAYIFEHRSVADIAVNVLGLVDRSTVSSTYRVEALTAVARRVLTLVEDSNPQSTSAGIRIALDWQVKRWDNASRHVQVALGELHLHRYGTSYEPDARAGKVAQHDAGGPS